MIDEITIWSKIMEMNFTGIVYAVTFCLSSVFTILRIKAMNKTENSKDKPGDSPSCRHHEHDMELIRNGLSETNQNQINTNDQITTIVNQHAHHQEETEKSISDIKTEFKNILDRLDNLLDDLLEAL